jgi:thioredoxin 1
LEQLSEQLADRLKVARMDVEEHPGLAGMLGIMGTPTFVLFRGGEPVNKSVGYRSKEALFATVRAWLEAK